jgi:hypothetical protein
MSHPTTLFVRSYPKDFHWLEYSILSMKKFLTGIDYKILVVPTQTHVPLPIREFFDEVIGSYLYQNLDGYVAQQFDKLDAHTYVDTDYILYSDSDCIYTAPFDTSLLFHDDLPILCMTPYTQLEGDGGHAWKAITENLLGFPVQYEYMRRFPIIHRRQTVSDLAKDYPNLAPKVVGRHVSEFNLIGAYAHRYRHLYHFTEDCSPVPCKQFWSWSGMTEEERQIIKDILS